MTRSGGFGCLFLGKYLLIFKDEGGREKDVIRGCLSFVNVNCASFATLFGFEISKASYYPTRSTLSFQDKAYLESGIRMP